MANQHIRDLDVASASKEIRLGSSLQLKVFLRTYELDVDSFSMQTNVVNYLTENCVDDGEEFSSNWNCAHCAHKHYDDFEHLLSVSISYDAAVDFCNELYEIVMNKRFDKNHLLAEWKGRWDKEVCKSRAGVSSFFSFFHLSRKRREVHFRILEFANRMC
ncbi:unnamed protein product [Meloidogyne enterolobii]|uniref:Uncharacterized protein n=1 Tax=Meloidogyne enterolobii TaxID=390850 RepID=A0ACB1AY83_MELEN